MTITDTPAQAPPAPRKPGAKAWAARIAGAVAAVALLAAGGLYALDRVDAAADRSAQAQAEAIRQAADDQVEAIRQAAADQVEIFNQSVGNDNTRIDEANKSIRAPTPTTPACASTPTPANSPCGASTPTPGPTTPTPVAASGTAASSSPADTTTPASGSSTASA